jgi:3-oxoadipate enol-lactonase
MDPNDSRVRLAYNARPQMITRRDFTKFAGLTAGTMLISSSADSQETKSTVTANPVTITSGFVQSHGAEIYYERTGSGPPIVFAHGLGGNHLSWWQQIPHFSQKYTCVTFAHRGFSPSRITSGSLDPMLFEEDLLALVDHLELNEVRLVAQSMGGWTCLNFAMHYPQRVRALVMAATGGAIDLRTLEAAELQRIEKWLSAHNGVDVELRKRGIHPAAGERMAREQPALQFLYWEIDRLSDFDKEALRAKLLAARTVPAAELKRLFLPVLFISGKEDVVFPPPAAAALANMIPGARLESVPEAGHSVYFERPAVFNLVVSSFFGANATKAAGASA